MRCLISLGNLGVREAVIEWLDILLDLVVVCHEIVADTEKFEKFSVVVLVRRLSGPAVRRGRIDEYRLQIVGWDIGLALAVEIPPLLPCTGLVVDVCYGIDKARSVEGVLDCVLVQHPAPQDRLLLEGEHQVWALDVDAVLDLRLALVCLGSETDKETQGLIATESEECIEAFGEFLNKGPNMADFEGVIESTILSVAEIEVDHERLGTGGARLLYEVHGATLLDKEVLVRQVEELGIVIICDKVLTTLLPCNRGRTAVCPGNSPIF